MIKYVNKCGSWNPRKPWKIFHQKSTNKMWNEDKNVTFPLCFQKIAAGISGLKTAQVRLSTDLMSMKRVAGSSESL